MQKIDPKPRDVHAFVCHGSRCTGRGAPPVRRELARALARLGLKAKVSRTSCQGRCKEGCVVFVERPRPGLWGAVRVEDAERLARKLAKRVRRGG